MIDPASSGQVINRFTGPDLTQGTVQPPQVDAADQARFQEALRERPEPTGHAAPPVETSAAGTGAESPASLGDTILRGLDKMRAHHRELGDQLESAARQHDLSPHKLLGMQMQISQVALNTQLVGQVASKVEQDLNTLLKSS